MNRKRRNKLSRPRSNARVPRTRRSFGHRWDEINYCYHKLLFWFYEREDRRRARLFAERLRRLLPAADREAILGFLCRSLIFELDGAPKKAIQQLERGCRLIENCSQDDPRMKPDVVRSVASHYSWILYGRLAKLYVDTGQRKKARNRLRKSKTFCQKYSIPFESDASRIREQWEENRGEYIKLLERESAAGDAEAQGCLGDEYYFGDFLRKNYRKAVEWFRKAAEQGDADSACRLGVCLADGHGISRNRRQAVHWYKKAAEAGDVDAQFNLGLAYAYGRGTRKNLRAASRWYAKAADNGNDWAMTNLGNMYREGRGVARDFDRAFALFEVASEKGDDDAQCSLGYAYARGQGVARDEAKAVHWYRKSAKRGHDISQCNLGQCYRDGEGVKRSRRWALYWFRKSIAAGNRQARREIASLEQ